MLDNVTKRRIDTARDILVGKVPDPKSQVEQITIALIYKFMDDMDAQAEEMGGQRSFFSGEYEKYGWAKLMSLGKGGHEVLNLYGEAITTMNQNEGIPPLFRDIFKNAYLPYRDPETLKSFLKIINDFEYDHSERLGDAFEYLLSVLGSQGDAGQFRTPRHIIDFMVAVIDPKKDESILDPACGTAGFLISSWKHVLQANSKDGRKGAGLTPDERKRLMENIKGYDISPDMVRLSLVNLYLHGFIDPHISEYDTLTSEDNWNQYSDIIMANPPFMSPKGGIKPHKRFSVQAKRSEVLFVDYIAEHLTPGGRAAIIVPNSVLFDETKACVSLRKMILNQCDVVGIIGLPPGVFLPYSDSETSIFIFKKGKPSTTKVWMYQATADGFSLDDKRAPIIENDLPEILSMWSDKLDSVKSFSVSIEDIKGKNYNLLPSTYKSDLIAIRDADLPEGWTLEPLIELIEEVKKTAGNNSIFPVLSVTKYDGFVESLKYFNKQVFSRNTSKYKVVAKNQFAYSAIHLDEGAIALHEDIESGIISPMYKVFRIKETVKNIDPQYLIQVLKSEPFIDRYKHLGKGSIKRRKSIPFKKFISLKIPIPPKKIQLSLIRKISKVKKLKKETELVLASIDNEKDSILKKAGINKIEK